MKSSWMPARVAAAVVFVLVAGARTTAGEIATLAGISPDNKNIIKKDTRSCKKYHEYYCTRTCEESVYTIGVCREGKNGPESPISVECCCCTEGFENRYFIGG